MPYQDRLLHQQVFDQVFDDYVIKACQGLQLKSVYPKANFIKALNFLLDKLILPKKDIPKPTRDTRVAKTVKQTEEMIKSDSHLKSMEKSDSLTTLTDTPLEKPKSIHDQYLGQKATIETLQKENNHLKLENQSLVLKLEKLQHLYDTITGEQQVIQKQKEKGSEAALKTFTDRKMILLQSQIVQLKRQLDVQRDQTTTNETFLFTTKDMISQVNKQLKGFIQSVS